MNCKGTSIEAYREIVENGLLSRRRMEVYTFIANYQPASLSLAIAHLCSSGQNTGAISGRFSELEELGVIEVCGEEVAPSGYRVNLYRVTRNLPGKLEKKERARDTILRLEKEIVALKSQLSCANQQEVA